MDDSRDSDGVYPELNDDGFGGFALEVEKGESV